MKALAKAGQWAFAICLLGLAGQQLYYSDLRPVFFPGWTMPSPVHAVLAYLLSISLIAAAVTLLVGKGIRNAMLLLGGLLLALAILSYAPFELFVDPNGNQVGSWNNAIKELCISGSCFIIAGAYDPAIAYNPAVAHNPAIAHNPAGTYPRFLVPMGRLFFSFMMIIFGFEHFLYAQGVRTLVPTYIPGDLFWTYFAAVALIGSGICIILGIKVKLVATLLGIMVFIWFLILHIPRAVVAPVTDKGNELSSVFESLGVSGIAFVIAYTYRTSTAISKHYSRGSRQATHDPDRVLQK